MSRSLVSSLVTVFFPLLIHSAASNLAARCRYAERKSLMEFKRGFDGVQKEGVLSNWASEECCEWSGVRCSDKTGHVIALDLSPSTFKVSVSGAEISSSLLELSRLNYLDLSHVNFHGLSSIPSFLGSLSELRYLNLSQTNLAGEIPHELGNLSRVEVLDLRSDDHGSIRTVIGMEWISRLSSLLFLDLSSTNMSLAGDWVGAVNNLPRLEYLALKQCALSDAKFPSLSLVNSSKSLAVLDLSSNFGPISSLNQWLFNHSHTLVRLDLSDTQLTDFALAEGFKDMASLEYLSLNGVKLGPIPESFGVNMTAIRVLSLRGCDLQGNIPNALGNMTLLEHLYLDDNKLGGEIPRSIWDTCTLRVFKANHNHLKGPLHFSESSSAKCTGHFPLEMLEIDNNRIEGSFPNLTLYPSLEWITLSSNRLSGNLSRSLGQLSRLKALLISDNMISGAITEAHFSKLYELNNLDLSSNSHIVFDVSPNWVPPFQLYYIRLSSCELGHSFPSWIWTQTSCSEIDLSNARISGPIPSWFWNFSSTMFDVDLSGNEITETGVGGNNTKLIRLKTLDLSSNQLSGSLPVSLLGVNLLRLSHNKFLKLNQICNISDPFLSLLDLSNNRLTGELPDCWSNLQGLNVLSLTKNELSGKIPSSLGLLRGLGALRLSHNSFVGEFPPSFGNFSQLMVLDLGHNRLSGQVPKWVGRNLSDLIILSLRENLFSGAMPSELCQLQNLHFLDVSSNNFSGTIPSCLGSLKGMREERFTYLTFVAKSILVTWKGVVKEFENPEPLKSIDLSSNRFIGEIPSGVTDLVGLVSLNLSRNGLSGEIPTEIGRLRSLDALDLSDNDLQGQIPGSLALIDRLGVLDLSNNNLSGMIPSGTQIRARDPSAYLGNPGLCGDPLPRKCHDSEANLDYPGSDQHEDQEDSFAGIGFGVSVGVGFVVGLCGVCGTLILSESWRNKYFMIWNDIGDWLHAVIRS